MDYFSEVHSGRRHQRDHEFIVRVPEPSVSPLGLYCPTTSGVSHYRVVDSVQLSTKQKLSLGTWSQGTSLTD